MSLPFTLGVTRDDAGGWSLRLSEVGAPLVSGVVT
ncbi:MAG: hypothetical protein RIT28_3572, partial [Pseudomonadota bacterium]